MLYFGFQQPCLQLDPIHSMGLHLGICIMIMITRYHGGISQGSLILEGSKRMVTMQHCTWAASSSPGSSENRPSQEVLISCACVPLQMRTSLDNVSDAFKRNLKERMRAPSRSQQNARLGYGVPQAAADAQYATQSAYAPTAEQQAHAQVCPAAW